MTSQPSLIQQVSGLTRLKHAMYRNEAFSYACGSYSRSLLSHHTLPVPGPHISLSSPHLYHQKQGEHLHQEAGNSNSSYNPDISHVTLENHITLIILSAKMEINKDHLYIKSWTWIRDS